MQGEIIECACGCGQLKPKRDRKGRIRRFIHGHNRRNGYRSSNDNIMIECKCGCGNRFLKHNEQGLLREYLPAHYTTIPKPTSERFWKYVLKTSSCWLWTAYKLPGGYGMASHNRQHILAHRVSYELTHGIIPDRLWVLHRCDNPSCVNPDHLFLGTAKDNTHDAIRKGRFKLKGGRKRGGNA